jgi:hypothetical protein
VFFLLLRGTGLVVPRLVSRTVWKLMQTVAFRVISRNAAVLII